MLSKYSLNYPIIYYTSVVFTCITLHIIKLPYDWKYCQTKIVELLCYLGRPLFLRGNPPWLILPFYQLNVIPAKLQITKSVHWAFKYSSHTLENVSIHRQHFWSCLISGLITMRKVLPKTFKALIGFECVLHIKFLMNDSKFGDHCQLSQDILNRGKDLI